MNNHGKVKAHRILLDENINKIKRSVGNLIVYSFIESIGNDYIRIYDNSDIIVMEATGISLIIDQILLVYIREKYPEAKLVSSDNKLYFHRK